MQPLRRLAHRGVVLLDKVPTDLHLGEVVGRAVGTTGGIWCQGRSGELLMVTNVAVRRHG